jgi:hypothetical protein
MSQKLGRAPRVLVVSNQQTTGSVWVFSLQQRQLNVLLEPTPFAPSSAARWNHRT